MNHPSRSDAVTAARAPYAPYAIAFLALALLAGVWLRAIVVEPALRGEFSYRNIVHAHSHVAFFGWATMMLFALIAGSIRGARTHWLHAHAHLVAIATAAAFAAFLAGGYSPLAIAISFVHVLLWLVFVALAWRPLADLAAPARSFYRAALIYLLIAAVTTFGPLLVVTGWVRGAWAEQLTVKLFLVCFITGWMKLGALGAVYQHIGMTARARHALGWIAAGALPSTLLFVPGTPGDVLTGIGRVGTALVAAGGAAFAWDALRLHRGSWLVGLTGVLALIQAAIEVLAVFQVGQSLMQVQPIVIAYLHLGLLGAFTSALLAAHTASTRPPRGVVTAYAIGLATMLAALLATGWPWLRSLAGTFGLDISRLLAVALAGALVVAGAVLAIAVQSAIGTRRAAPVKRLSGAAFPLDLETPGARISERNRG